MERTGNSPRNIRRLIAKRTQQHITNVQSTSSFSINNSVQQLVTPIVNIEESISNREDSDSESEHELAYADSSSDDEIDNQDNFDPIKFKNDLKSWAISHCVPGVATQSLLKILKSVPSLEFLPTDQRTLLKSENDSVAIISIGEGNYSHLGLKQNILRQLRNNMISYNQVTLPIVLSLTLSFDGIPISKSNTNQFWPIQGKIRESKFGVFVIGIYFGKTKPTSLDLYLNSLIEELKILKDEGFIFSNQKFYVRLSQIIADAPARSYIKQCKVHNSYSACEKCTDKGVWAGRVIFQSLDSPIRTDESFNLQIDKNHHTGTSPFSRIGFSLVSCVPLDFMHLVCLGVVRKILRCWVKGPLPYKLSAKDITRLSQSLCELNTTCPREFSRKPRSAKEIDMWKATEFRTFLLYTGPIVLKNLLPKEKYYHFLLLSVAITILITNKAKNIEWNNYAGALLKEFVIMVPRIYSKEFLSYNMHSLLHLSSDALKHGPLDSFSAFEYENNMQFIKRSIRASYKPLEQSTNRIREMESAKMLQPISEKSSFIINRSNNCYRLKSGRIIVIISRKLVSGKIRCKKFSMQEDLFARPCKSSTLGIFLVSKMLAEYEILVDEIDIKCWLLPFGTKFVTVPLYNSKL
jgi:hypothetical protein